MADTIRYFHAYNGTKLEYGTENPLELAEGTGKPTGAKASWTGTQIACVTSTPDIGGEPNTIDTTNLDNTEYESQILGLKPVQTYTFEFNLEDPTANANIKLASDLEDAGTDAWWKYSLSNGIIIAFQSKCTTTITGGGSGDLLKFSMTVTPDNGVVYKYIPTASI